MEHGFGAIRRELKDDTQEIHSAGVRCAEEIARTITDHVAYRALTVVSVTKDMKLLFRQSTTERNKRGQREGARQNALAAKCQEFGSRKPPRSVVQAVTFDAARPVGGQPTGNWSTRTATQDASCAEAHYAACLPGTAAFQAALAVASLLAHRARKMRAVL